MPKEPSFADVRLDVMAGEEASTAAVESEDSFRIAILGDFSGRANRGLLETGHALACRTPVMVDRDNFDAVMRKLSPRITLPIGGAEAGLSLKFQDLDDFGPDRLYENTPLFQKLREIRRKASDPNKFAQVATELGLAGPAPEPHRPEATPAAPAAIEPIISGSLLDDIVDSTENRAEPRHASRDNWSLMMDRLVAPYRVAKADPRQAEVVDVIDRATGAQMRALLHARAFQELEAAWRSVFFLVRNLDTDSNLKVFLIDVSKQELAADLASSGDGRATGTYRLLVEGARGTFGAARWSLLVGNFAFGAEPEDTDLLRRMARMAAGAGAPFVSSASPRLLGCDSAQDLVESSDWRRSEQANGAWQAFRQSPEARFIGLVLPRLLLRLPYGKDTLETEIFPFEECAEPGNPEECLWGNPAFACALLLGQSFTEQGAAMHPGSFAEVSGLPFYAYESGGETRTLPCAEILMTETVAEAILERGLMPLASIKDQASARLVRFQSIAQPLAPLAGPWAG